MHLYLTPEQQARLRRAAHQYGMTMTQIVREAVISRLVLFEEESRLELDRKEARKKRHLDEDNNRPMGLGLDIDTRKRTSAPASPTVTVEHPQLERLALYIYNSTDDAERDRRLNIAVESLAAQCDSQEEAETLAQKLDARVESLEGEKTDARKRVLPIGLNFKL